MNNGDNLRSDRFYIKNFEDDEVYANRKLGRERQF